MTKKWLVLLALLAPPAGAYLPPELSLRRTEVVQLIPYARVAELKAWMQELPPDLSPEGLLQRLQARFQDRSLAFAFYAGWCYLDQLDRLQQAYKQRGEELEQAGKEYLDYQARAEQRLNADSLPEQPQSLQLGPVLNPPVLRKDETGFQFFRFLPWPERGWTPRQVEQLLAASREDQERLKQQSARLQPAREQVRGLQDRWAQWLLDWNRQSADFTAGQMLQPIPPGWVPSE